MATIYQTASGDSVYDYNGQTYNAKTGAVYAAPTTAAPAPTTTATAPAPTPYTAPTAAPAPTTAPQLPGLGGSGYTNTAPIDYSKLNLAPTATAPAPTNAIQSTNPATQQYSFVQMPNGNIDILENGKSIYGAGTPGVSPTYAATLGYTAPTAGQVLGTSTTATQPTVGSGGALATNVSNAIGATVPSTALGAGMTSSDLLTKASGVYDQYKSYQDQLLTASTPSAAETQASQQIRDLNTKLAQGIAKINSQAIPEPLIGLQSNKLQEQIASVIKPLQDELTGLIEQRSTRVDALTRVMQATPELIQMLGNIQKLTMPNVLGTQVNSTTGDVYSIVQSPDGGVTTQLTGNIGSNNAGKTYVQTGTYQDGTGQQFFYGVKPDGTIENVQLAGKGGTPTQYGKEMYGSTGGGTSTFSQTQLNKGASNAGISIADFGKLDSTSQNYFINGYSTFKTAVLNKVASGDMTAEEAAQIVQTSTSVPDSAKQYLLKLLGVGTASASTSADSGSGFWGSVGGAFTGAASAVYDWWNSL